MTVSELIEALKGMSPDREVKILTNAPYAEARDIEDAVGVNSVPVFEDDPEGDRTESVVLLIPGGSYESLNEQQRAKVQTALGSVNLP